MIQKQTKLAPLDKCGVWLTRVFHLYGGFRRQCISIGGFAKSSVRLTRPNNWLKKKVKLKSILVKTAKETSKLDGSYLRFRSNNNVLLKKRLTPRGKEIIGPAPRKINRKRFLSSFTRVV